MTNRREFKKHVKYVCGDIAAECIIAKYYIKGIDVNKMDEIVIRLATLQETMLSRSNVNFDKTPKTFASFADYKKNRKKFMSKAFESLNVIFDKEILDIVKEMNKLLPQEQKELNKEALKK